MRWEKIKFMKTMVFDRKVCDWDKFNQFAEGKDFTDWTDIYSNYTAIFPKLDRYEDVWVDHISIFRNKKTGQIWLTSQPYHSREEVEKLVKEYCRKDNLKYEIFDGTKMWHHENIKHGCLIVITK